jgi:hypothetical protein
MRHLLLPQSLSIPLSLSLVGQHPFSFLLRDLFKNDDTSLHLRVCSPSRGDGDDDGFTLLGMNVLPFSRVRAAGRLLLLTVVSSDGSEDAVIHGDSRKLGR